MATNQRQRRPLYDRKGSPESVPKQSRWKDRITLAVAFRVPYWRLHWAPEIPTSSYSMKTCLNSMFALNFRRASLGPVRSWAN
jgi:hypothetical protein